MYRRSKTGGDIVYVELFYRFAHLEETCSVQSVCHTTVIAFRLCNVSYRIALKYCICRKDSMVPVEALQGRCVGCFTLHTSHSSQVRALRVLMVFS